MNTLKTLKENIVDSLSWFYELLIEHDISVIQKDCNEIATMVITNNFYAPISDDEEFIITDDEGNAIFADWKYKEV